MSEQKKQKESKKSGKIKSKAQNKAMEAAVQMRGGSSALGSYTGTARGYNNWEKPEQDADDL